METARPIEKMKVVGKGSTQLLFETSFDVKPPMSNPIGESYDVAITEYTALNDRVLIKGTVEKTLYYKHQHGKKGQDSAKKNANNGGDSQNNEHSDNDNSDDNNTEETGNDDSATAKKSFRFLYKLRKNSRKEKANNQKKTGENKNQQSGNNKTQNKDKNNNCNKNKSKNNATKSAAEKTDELKCLSGSGQLVDSAHGIVHFHQQVLQFAGTVEIPGVRPGDSFEVERAEGRSFEAFTAIAAESENNNSGNSSNNNGLIEAATHKFVVDIVLTAKRNKPEKYSLRKNRNITALPLEQNVPLAKK